MVLSTRTSRLRQEVRRRLRGPIKVEDRSGRGCVSRVPVIQADVPPLSFSSSLALLSERGIGEDGPSLRIVKTNVR